ncbi:unnamed protein product [Lymnaea stagnalis]|uniref:Uncharacterized protein n=1 Tax=Lymnaea stagnalis TaxID=6523 RepID=A0AAV2IPR4_LYMST
MDLSERIVKWSQSLSKMDRPYKGSHFADHGLEGSVIDVPLMRQPSVIVRIREARRQSKGPINFFSKSVAIIMSTVCFTVLMTLIWAVPITKIALGTVYIGDCPARPEIPFFLIVSGAVSTARDFFAILMRCVFTEEQYFRHELKLGCFVIFIEMIDVGLLAYGSYIIFGLTNWNFEENSPRYCRPALYWFAFWVTAGALVTLATLISLCCCVACTLPLRDEPPVTEVDIVTIPQNTDLSPSLVKILPAPMDHLERQSSMSILSVRTS